METREEFQEHWRREQRLRQRLRLAAFRLEAAQVERVWAVLSAHRQGLSIREIAAAIGLSRARVHQLLNEATAAQVPTQVNRLREDRALRDHQLEHRPNIMLPSARSRPGRLCTPTGQR